MPIENRFWNLLAPSARSRGSRPRRDFCPVVDPLERKLVLETITYISTTTMLEVIGGLRFTAGQSIDIRAKVMGAGRQGRVDLVDNGISIGNFELGSAEGNPPGGVYSIDFFRSDLGVGTHTLQARFGGVNGVIPGYGGTIVRGSESDLVTITIVPQVPTVTTVGQSNATPLFGRSTTLYAVVMPGEDGANPTGPITFLDGSTPIGTANLVTENGQTYAALEVSNLGPGSHRVTASFGFDGTHAASLSDPTTITVAPNSATAAGQSNATPAPGETTTLYAVVTSLDPDGPAPTGTITYLDGPTILGSSTLMTVPDQTNTSLAVSGLGAGSHVITMYYSGDAAHSASAATTTITVSGLA